MVEVGMEVGCVWWRYQFVAGGLCVSICIGGGSSERRTVAAQTEGADGEEGLEDAQWEIDVEHLG